MFDGSRARRLSDNAGIYQRSPEKGAKFELTEEEALAMLGLPNPNGRSNAEVVHRWANAQDIAQARYSQWIIDFHEIKSEAEASQYEAPFEYIRAKVFPFRQKNRYAELRESWWRFRRSGEGVRAAAKRLRRFLCTPMVAKHRLFVWLDSSIQPDKTVPVFARDDDYFFGVLHSAVHERWSLRMGTALEDRPRYTPTTCFETFPFPPLAGGIAREADGASEKDRDVNVADQKVRDMNVAARARIAAAAAKLNELRENWLNPKNGDGSPALTDAQLKKRTLTNLYNDRPTWLELAHLELDRAVLAAYGWPEDWAEKLQPKRDEKGKVNPILGVVEPAIEQEVLGRLLGMNLAMAREA